eukprot:5314488-Pyramimonas_sp.AAC.1
MTIRRPSAAAWSESRSQLFNTSLLKAVCESKASPSGGAACGCGVLLSKISAGGGRMSMRWRR